MMKSFAVRSINVFAEKDVAVAEPRIMPAFMSRNAGVLRETPPRPETKTGAILEPVICTAEGEVMAIDPVPP